MPVVHLADNHKTESVTVFDERRVEASLAAMSISEPIVQKPSDRQKNGKTTA